MRKMLSVMMLLVAMCRCCQCEEYSYDNDSEERYADNDGYLLDLYCNDSGFIYLTDNDYSNLNLDPHPVCSFGIVPSEEIYTLYISGTKRNIYLTREDIIKCFSKDDLVNLILCISYVNTDPDKFVKIIEGLIDKYKFVEGDNE